MSIYKRLTDNYRIYCVYSILIAFSAVGFTNLYSAKVMSSRVPQYFNSTIVPQVHSQSTDVQVLNETREDKEASEGAYRNRFRNERVHYMQDFEEGWAGWTTFDHTFPTSMWHLTQFNAHGDEGYSWWMADPEIGGYRNAQYTYLDTPQIMVSAANSTLTFNLNYRVEGLGNWQDPNNPNEFYNGWDGANVRISTNNGETWTVISGTPAYNSTSMFSFGRIYGEGPNVPGWGGNSNGWVNASFDLQQYIGQNVRIRFTFASDNSVDSVSNPELYSILIDNISLGDFNQNFNDGEVHGMTFGSKVPIGGDLWHIGEPLPLPPSPTHAVMCQNEQGTYNRNMFNYLYSPPIQLPSGGDIRVDFMVTGGIYYEFGTFPNSSYWGFDITPDDGNTWYAMSNPYGDPGGLNFIYVGAPENWTSAVTGYQFLDGVISEYAGETVRFRWYLRTIDEPPVGRGLLIDNFVIYHRSNVPDQAVNPNPANDTTGVSIHLEELSWDYIVDSTYVNPIGFRVYFNDIGEFGTEDDFEWIYYEEERESYTAVEILPDELSSYTTYYWKVVPTTIDPNDGRYTEVINNSRPRRVLSMRNSNPIMRGDAEDVPVWNFTTEVILSPPLVTIDVFNEEDIVYVKLQWQEIPNARSYRIYASSSIVLPFEEWGEPIYITGETVFQKPIVVEGSRFYRVVASFSNPPED